MYTYAKAVGLSRSIGSQWKEVDLLHSIVLNIYQNYTKVFLVLMNPALTGEVYIDFDSLKTKYGSYSKTLKELLVELGDTALDTVPSLPAGKIKFAKYSDALKLGYKVTLCKAGLNLPENYPQSELPDISIERPVQRTNMELVNDYCLTSVNGYYHWLDATTEKAFIYDGAVTMRKSKVNHLGLLSFMDIGKLTKIKITPDRIQTVDVNTTLKNKLNISVDQNLDGKSYILVLGGYLVLPQQDVFWRSGDKGFTLNLQSLPYLERLLESNSYIDLSSLGLTKLPMNDEALSTDEVFSDEVIRKYLTLSQSFLVLVDVPNMLYNKIHVRHSSLPGMFTSYQKPQYPLIVNHGKVAEYWATHEDGHWSLSVQDSFLRNYIVSQQPVKSHRAVTDQLLAGKPFYHSRGFFLELAGYKDL